jgi:hypothetical protein
MTAREAMLPPRFKVLEPIIYLRCVMKTPEQAEKVT